MRLSVKQFEELLQMVKPEIEKQDTRMRYAISPRVRLAITLRFIATGDSYRSLEYLAHVSRSTIASFVPEVLQAIFESLQPISMKIPNTTEEWNKVSQDFEKFWHFPHTLGALDGKHIRIKAPSNQGSKYYNYKGFHSIVLFAVVDAHCKFLFIDVGCNGRSNDSAVYKESYLYKKLHSGELNIPLPRELEGQILKTPYYFIGDDAFQLSRNLMKPFSRNLKLTPVKEIYNYRLCRARMTVECAFGRLANRFRIFHRPIEVIPQTTDLIIKAACVLHNYMTEEKKVVTTEELEIEKLPETLDPINLQEADSYKFASKIRDNISQYCVSEGNVPFQWDKIK